MKTIEKIVMSYEFPMIFGGVVFAIVSGAFMVWAIFQK